MIPSYYQPSQLKELLKKLGKLPQKGLSQNFLIDGNILKKIIKSAAIEKGDLVLEIGPGPGALTVELLKAGANVIAIEKDPIFAEHLKNLKLANLKVLEEDFLKSDLTQLPILFHEHSSSQPLKIKVVANLPYHITTPILLKLFQHSELFYSLILMVQKEVGKRIVAKPKTKDYSSLTLLIQTYGVPTLSFLVAPTSFYPAPKVFSAVVTFTLKTPPLQGSILKAWHTFVQKSFQQRRKKLTSSLAKIYGKEKIKEALINLKLSLNSRPEELAFEEFLALFQTLNP